MLLCPVAFALFPSAREVVASKAFGMPKKSAEEGQLGWACEPPPGGWQVSHGARQLQVIKTELGAHRQHTLRLRLQFFQRTISMSLLFSSWGCKIWSRGV